MTERRRDVIRMIIRLVQSAGEYMLISIILIAVTIAIYALWDIRYVASKGQPTEYAVYKPGENQQSYEELVRINPEVIGWIDIYGTNIDYPVLQTTDNEKYLSYAANGRYSLAGSIFLDCRNRPDFTDFNNVIHGHSMSHNAMFGDISDFTVKEFYDSHKYGDLFFNDRHHGLRIVGVVEVDAYATGLYRMIRARTEDKDRFFDEVRAEVMFGIDENDLDYDNTYVLLNTCHTASTNGRHILICVLTDETYPDTFTERKTRDTVEGPRLKIRLFLIVLIIIILLIILALALRNYDRKKDRELDERLKQLLNK